MAGAAQQQPQPGQQVATDPKKAGDGQIFKGGDVKGEGHDDFQKAREAANEKLRKKQEADAAAEQQKVADDQRKAKIEGEAEALVKGIDLDQIAKEVDEDFSLAEKFRSFRKMTPEAQTKLTELRQRVSQRRQKRIEELMNDPDLNSEIDAALQADAKKQPVQAPPQQPQKPAGQQEPSGQQAPAEGTPNAQPGQQPQVPQPPQQINDAQLLDQRLAEIRTEFNEKFEKQQNELEQERVRRQDAEKKMKEMQDAQKAEQQKQVRTDFNGNAKKLGIPEDLLDVAFSKATEIVNANQRQMSWNEIFNAMKDHYPSLFRDAKGGGQQPPAEGGAEGDGSGQAGGETQKKVTVKAGTGTSAGGKGNPPAQPTKKKGDGHDSFADARKAIAERAEKMISGG